MGDEIDHFAIGRPGPLAIGRPGPPQDVGACACEVEGLATTSRAVVAQKLSIAMTPMTTYNGDNTFCDRITIVM